jgi:hypothetical protein
VEIRASVSAVDPQLFRANSDYRALVLRDFDSRSHRRKLPVRNLKLSTERPWIINRMVIAHTAIARWRRTPVEAPSLPSVPALGSTRTLSRSGQPCPFGRACRLMRNFLDGRGLPQVNPVIGLRFWPEPENRFRSFERVAYTSSASRKCREEKSVENRHWLPNSSLKGAF